MRKAFLVSLNCFNMAEPIDCCIEIDDDTIELHNWSIVKSRIRNLFSLFCLTEVRTYENNLKDVTLKFLPHSNFCLKLFYEDFWSKHSRLYILCKLLLQFKLDAAGYQNIYVNSEYIFNDKLRCIEYLVVRETFDYKNLTSNYLLEDFEYSKYEFTSN